MKKQHGILIIVSVILMLTIPIISVYGQKIISPDSQGSDKTNISSSLLAIERGGTYFNVLDVSTNAVTQYTEKEYLFGVVASEMPAKYPLEALKAQAVAAYTLACIKRRQERTSPDPELLGADITNDSTIDQAFRPRETICEKWGDDAEEYMNKIDSAIDAVYGQVVMYQDDLADTLYHAISAGKTEAAETVWGKTIDYLVPVDSVGDLFASDYLTTVVYTPDEFEKIAKELGATLKGKCASWLSAPIYSESGTVISYVLGDLTLTGKEIRSAFSLRSANFDLAYANEVFVFTVRGYGHGVGMSQNGAKYMAEQNSTYDEILLWYYQGCRIENISKELE